MSPVPVRGAEISKAVSAKWMTRERRGRADSRGRVDGEGVRRGVMSVRPQGQGEDVASGSARPSLPGKGRMGGRESTSGVRT